MANGWSSREKSRLAIRRTHQVPKQDENTMNSPSAMSDEELMDARTPQAPRDMPQSSGPKRSTLRLISFFLPSFMINFLPVFRLITTVNLGHSVKQYFKYVLIDFLLVKHLYLA